MKARIILAEATSPDGGRLSLYEQDGAYGISHNGQELMHSRANASEILLGQIGVAHLARDATARVLVGGLGLGHTLRSVLDATGPAVTVDVVELIPAVVEWNRTHLAPLNRDALNDPRCHVRVADAGSVIHNAKAHTYDTILLDLDNGPVAMVAVNNARLYAGSGLRAVHAALKPGGCAVFWSAGPDKAFAARLTQQGFTTEAVPAKVHDRAKRAAYMLYVARRKKS
ncbi:spermidine synthase [Synoicihabitans lomoniglobus]|uniref:Spermine synthase n=1 Tax=Synoicihabitans lomoniglobus TaxID=2909285 RepID=A0AAF0CPF3_9BACT|nr:hypothetical protein [Opitutaceae bacterium LMO-M01]WED64444.1 hypothetical protein PXH66_19060 [Opitutaceae bacterium LMO-M01]